MSTPVATRSDRPAAPVAGLEVDWALAARWGARMAAPGPTASRGELERAVAHLHDSAARALPLALRAARLGRAVTAAGRLE